MDLEANTFSRTQTKRSSRKTLRKRSALEADRNGFGRVGAKIYPELIADLLMDGHKVKFRAPGYSMHPTILNDDEIRVEPIKPDAIRVGDIILYKDKENLIAHRVVQIGNKGDSHTRSQSSVLSPQSYFTLRGDARPTCDDPVSAEHILGKVVLVETNGRSINPYSFKAKLIFIVRRLIFRLKRFLN